MKEDFLIPFRPPEENNAEKVSQAIDDYDQSEKDEEDAPKTIYDKEMDLRITLVKRPIGAGRCKFIDDEAECSDDSDEDDEEEEEDEAEEELSRSLGRRSRQTRSPPNEAPTLRRGGSGRKKLQYIPGLSVVESALIRIPKYDNRCLFYAIAVARLYNRLMHDTDGDDDEEKRKNRARTAYNQVERLRWNHKRLAETAIEMMESAGIPQGLPVYTHEHVKQLQDSFDRGYPETFRIVIFGEKSGHKSLYNGGVISKYNLILYHNNCHYDVIKSAAQFFDRRNYCIDCEVPYSHKEQHTQHCRMKCGACLRFGQGKVMRARGVYRCKPDGHTNITCADCHRTFESQICYDEHLKHACRYMHHCLKCGHDYRVRAKTPHICYTSFCKNCHVYHGKWQKCFIPTLEISPDALPYRITSIDFESEIHEKVSVNKEKHKVNYVSMHITCTECIANSKTGI